MIELTRIEQDENRWPWKCYKGGWSVKFYGESMYFLIFKDEEWIIFSHLHGTDYPPFGKAPTFNEAIEMVEMLYRKRQTNRHKTLNNILKAKFAMADASKWR